MDIIAIEKAISSVIEENNMELVDIEYRSESGKKVLRIFLDKEGGITLDDCGKMSTKVGDVLDKSEIVPESYVLEVSSPGLERVLKKEKDFIRFKGSRAKIMISESINGQRKFLGKIISVENGNILIDDVTKGKVSISLARVVKAHLAPEM
ncbi:ribosome maturation factor RimP [Elusimicrobiota bacterium]